jgi:hypothetical protein
MSAEQSTIPPVLFKMLIPLSAKWVLLGKKAMKDWFSQ